MRSLPAARLLCVCVLAALPASAPAKDLIEYFRPMPITAKLTSDTWGLPGVLPRDVSNGLEDTANQWCYWDGKILRSQDGRYHLFASRWPEKAGHHGWSASLAIHAVSDHVTGPYVDQGPLFKDHESKGHNVTADLLPDGRWVVHIVVNWWNDRKAYHLTSLDGIHDWKLAGLAYDPRRDFIRYADGTVNRWTKLERPGIVMENGHITHFTFAVIDSEKDVDQGGDHHGSKVIVVPFDGAAFDADHGAAPPAP